MLSLLKQTEFLATKLLTNSRRLLTLIFLSMLATPTVIAKLSAQNTDNAKMVSSIAGRVTIHGMPGANLTVGLFKDNRFERDHLIAKTETDAEGRFQFSRSESDHYWLKVLSPNYVAKDWQSMQGRRVTLREGESVSDADWDVIPGGAVAGRIMDVDGDPVVGEAINLFPVFDAEPYYEPVRLDERANTHATGSFRVLGIPPGRYIVGIGEDISRITGAVQYKNDFFAAHGRIGRDRYYEQTLYPGVLQREQAHVFEISSGEELRGIDFTVGKVHRSYRVSGRVIEADTSGPVRNCHIRVGYAYGNSSYSVNGPSDVNEDGVFSFSGFLPGRFFVNALFSNDSELYGESVCFEVKDGDVEGVVIRARTGLTINGKVDIEGPPLADALKKRSQLKLKLSSPSGSRESAFVDKEIAVDKDGRFKIIGIPRGTVELSAFFCDVCELFEMDRVEYVEGDSKNELKLGEKGLGAHSRTLDLDSNLKGVRVVLHYKAASILCHVNVVGKLPPNVRLMVDVDSGIGKGGWAGWRDVDANGDMLETGLEPGEYALEVGDGGRRFTEKKRIKVTRNEQTKVSFTIDASKIQERL